MDPENPEDNQKAQRGARHEQWLETHERVIRRIEENLETVSNSIDEIVHVQVETNRTQRRLASILREIAERHATLSENVETLSKRVDTVIAVFERWFERNGERNGKGGA